MARGFVVFLTGFILIISSSILQADSTFYGIGCVLSHSHNSTLIHDVLPGSPAENAGLHSGEYIVAVDATSTTKMPLSQVVNLIRGQEGTLVTITSGDLHGHNRSLAMKRVAITPPSCFMEGNIQLNFINGGAPGHPVAVYGNIGDVLVNWSIAGNIVYAQYQGEYLTFMLISNGMQNTIQGAVHGYFISWTGSSVINTYQSCIP